MCTYNKKGSHTNHFEMQKRDSEESILKYIVNILFVPQFYYLVWYSNEARSFEHLKHVLFRNR